MPAPKIGTIVGEYRFKGGDPNSQESWELLSGKDFLNTLPIEQQGVIQKMVSGDISPPTSMALSKPYWQKTIAQAIRYDPTFSETLWPARVAMRKDLATGKLATNKNAINTALQHSKELYDAISGVSGLSVPLVGNLVNGVVNAWESNQPEQTHYDNALNALGHELRRVYAQVGAGTESDLDRFLGGMGKNLSTAAKVEALKTQFRLLAGKLNSNKKQVADVMGPNYKYQPFDAKTLKAIQEMGFKPEDIGLDSSEFEGGDALPKSLPMKPPPQTNKRGTYDPATGTITYD